ncbi:uncharacterized protein THITE_2113079 [Thermothielavioides terrestris NRRL 8126]|uniref:DUF3824 domain-containing protein n=1 Tax=Thermothielavioides terrestris (strain ATCC 38088 / NRRL 8126) TaxID=578455 RepID=G2R1K2_THETT|nr:uncharacterized protein THITE_2113079 [Thermothielavioides terrestris NRRL 8126]AEO65741.1 hypothetical protein THITE_2113079 [Thermothielavioides terrestris NRRL 8126]
MASYDPYDAPARERTTRRYYREERRDDRDPRYWEARETHLHVQPSRDLVPRPREDSDLSVEEIRRDFPPPGYSSRDIRRARSAEPGYYDEYDDRRSHYSRDRDYDDYDRKSHKKSEVAYYEEERRSKVRMLSKQEQIIAAVTGAALAIGGKELYDRREASQHGTEVHRNLLASAALGAVGAFAGYQGTELYNKYKEKEEKKAHRSGYYSDDDESVKEKKGHKNFLESALAAAGLGGAVKALAGGGGKDDRSDTRSRRGSRSPSRSRSASRSRGKDRERGGKSEVANKVQKAAMASLIAGATEAFRISKQPGSWKGEKAKRILTAAAGAATLDAAQNPEKAGSKLGLAEAVVGGLLGNRVINGSKKNIEMDERTGRSRSRSRARSRDGGGSGVSGLAALATAGLGAFGAKKLMDSHERSRSRRRSPDSRDSRDGSPDRRHRSRSRSVVDAARRGLAKVGIGNGPDDDYLDRRDRSRDRRRDYDDYEDSGRSRRHRDDYDDYDRDRSRDRRRGGGGRDDYDDDHPRRSGGRDRSRQGRRGSVSSDDLGDSDEDRKRDRKLRGKQIITTGLAAVATIHAAHSVYQSMEKRHARNKAVREGQLSPEEAEKLKKRALLQDAAAVGIAALGIKGAISEVKEARELRHEMLKWKVEKEERHRRRLERQKRLANGGDGGGGDLAGRQRADSWSASAPPGADWHNEGPRYIDGNPYGAMVPAGPSDRR